MELLIEPSYGVVLTINEEIYTSVELLNMDTLVLAPDDVVTF